MHTPETQQDIALKNMERLESREARMVWAPSLANGALLLALLGIIGNVPNPNQALDFLGLPISCLGMGVFIGGGCGFAYTSQGRLMTRHSGAEIYMRYAGRYIDEGDHYRAAYSATQGYALITMANTPEDLKRLAETHPQEALNSIASKYGEKLIANFAKQKRLQLMNNWCFWLSFGCLACSGLSVAILLLRGCRLQG